METKLEFSSPKDALCKAWLNWPNVFSQYRNYLPLEKVVALHLNKFISPLTKDALCQVWLKLTQRFWRRRWKCEKFTPTTTTTTTATDNGQMLIRNAHSSLRLRWTKNHRYYKIPGVIGLVMATNKVSACGWQILNILRFSFLDSFKAWNSSPLNSKWLIMILGLPFIGKGNSLYDGNTRTGKRNSQSINQTINHYGHAFSTMIMFGKQEKRLTIRVNYLANQNHSMEQFLCSSLIFEG